MGARTPTSVVAVVLDMFAFETEKAVVVVIVVVLVERLRAAAKNGADPTRIL